MRYYMATLKIEAIEAIITESIYHEYFEDLYISVITSKMARNKFLKKYIKNLGVSDENILYADNIEQFNNIMYNTRGISYANSKNLTYNQFLNLYKILLKKNENFIFLLSENEINLSLKDKKFVYLYGAYYQKEYPIIIDGTHYDELILTYSIDDKDNIAFKLKSRLPNFKFNENKFEYKEKTVDDYNDNYDGNLLDNAHGHSVEISINEEDIITEKENRFKDKSRRFKKENNKADIQECINVAKKIFEKYGFHIIDKNSLRIVAEKKEHNNMFIVLEFKFYSGCYISIVGRIKYYTEPVYFYQFAIHNDTNTHFSKNENTFRFKNEEDDYLHYSKTEELTMLLEIFLNKKYPIALKYFDYNMEHGYVNDNYLEAEFQK